MGNYTDLFYYNADEQFKAHMFSFILITCKMISRFYSEHTNQL